MDCSQSGNGNLGCIRVKADRENWFDKYSSVIANAIVYIYTYICIKEIVTGRIYILDWSLSSLGNKGYWILSWLNTYESCRFFCNSCILSMQFSFARRVVGNGQFWILIYNFYGIDNTQFCMWKRLYLII